MEFGILNLIELFGALGFFIYGMKVMSEGIQKAAGSQMRRVLGAMTTNRYLGVLSGFLITLLVQSSSATTVMTVSFVNAGLLTLLQSAGIMMGANIGTTITGWLVATFGFKVKIVALALPIIAVGFPLLFVRKANYRFWGEFLIGFALLFMGLDFLKHSVPDIKQNPEMLSFLTSFTDLGYISYVIFIFIGALLTIVVQSSSASMTITLVLVAKGWISFDIAAAMVLGENIGTTITAELASIVGNVHAKRSARIHSMFNIIGVTWMLLVFPFFLQMVGFVLIKMGVPSPLDFVRGVDQDALSEAVLSDRIVAVTFGLSTFHTLFNLINVVVLIGFAHKLAELAIRMVKAKGEDDEKFSLEYISTGVLSSPDLALMEAKKELANFSKLIRKMMNNLTDIVYEKEAKVIKKKLKKIARAEEITDDVEVEISKYLVKVAELELTQKNSIKIRSMLSITNDLERIADIIFQMSKTFERKIEKKIWFSPEQRVKLKEIYDKVSEAIEFMIAGLNDDYDNVDLERARELEREIDKIRSVMRKEHLLSVEAGDYNILAGLVYTDLFSGAEKVGDHVENVVEAIKGVE